MTREIQYNASQRPIANTLYAAVLNAALQVWNGTAFVEMSTAPLAVSCLVACAQLGASPFYVANMPSGIVLADPALANAYTYAFYDQTGAAIQSPVLLSALPEMGSGSWPGSSLPATYVAAADVIQNTTPTIVIGPFWSNSSPYGPLTSGTPTLTIMLPGSTTAIATSGTVNGPLNAAGKTTYTFAASETATLGQISLGGTVGSTSLEWSEDYIVGAISNISTAIATLTTALAAGQIQPQSPIGSGGQLYVDTADDYPAGRALQFGVPSTFMSLSGSTPMLDITQVVGGVPSATPVLTISGTIQTGTYTINGVQYSTILQFLPTAAQTALLTQWSPNSYVYRVRCVWTSPTAQTITVVQPTPCTALW